MPMQNFAISHTAHWQGWLVERWDLPAEADGGLPGRFGGLALLPFMAPSKHRVEIPVGAAVPEAIEP